MCAGGGVHRKEKSPASVWLSSLARDEGECRSVDACMAACVCGCSVSVDVCFYMTLPVQASFCGVRLATDWRRLRRRVGCTEGLRELHPLDQV